MAPFDDDHRWTCLVPPGALCAGLSFDIDDAAVGASWKPDADAPVVTAACLDTMSLGKLTIASLRDACKIEIRWNRGGVWLFGVLVTHSDGGAEALGSFSPEPAAAIPAAIPSTLCMTPRLMGPYWDSLLSRPAVPSIVYAISRRLRRRLQRQMTGLS